MQIPSIDFFTRNEVLFLGYSRNPKNFSRYVAKGFEENGIKVYPVNINGADNSDIKVYQDLDELENIPETAYILLNKDHTAAAFQTIKDKGIKRILFHNKSFVDSNVLDECRNKGIEAQFACPLLIFGKGFHKIHKFFASIF